MVILMLSSGFASGSHSGSIVKGQLSEPALSTGNRATVYTSSSTVLSPFSAQTLGVHKENPAGAGSTIDTISVGNTPWGISYNNATQQMFVANSGSGDFSVIQSSTNSVSYSFSLPPSPLEIAYDPVNTYLYASDTTLSLLWVLAPSSPTSSTYTVTTEYTLPGAGYGVIYDSVNNLIYVAIPSLNEVVALNPGTGQNEASIFVGSSSDPQLFAYDPTNGYMLVTDRGINTVSAIDTSTQSFLGVISVGTNPIGITYDPTNKDMYVANYDSESISVISTTSYTTVATISVPGQRIEGLAFDPTNSLVYAADYYNTNFLTAGNTVSVINTTTNSVVGTITVGQSPVSVAYDPANEEMYVTNSGSDSVSVISSPSVSVSPSTYSIDAGQTIILTATPQSGSGSYPSYSWYSKTPGSSTLSAVGGVTAQTYSFVTSTNSVLGTYYFEATVTDSNGATSLLSSEASVTVLADPTVSISPSGSVTYTVGQTASQLTASVTYTGQNTVPIEWYSNVVDSSSGGTDTGYSGTVYTPPTTTAGTVYYYATVRDSGVSGYSSTSNVVELTVRSAHYQAVNYSGYFQENGLPTGTAWEITVDGQTFESNNQSIFLILPAGTYSYTVSSVAGYSASPSSGTFTVNFAPFGIEISFSIHPMNGYLTGSIPSTYSLFINGIQYNTSQGLFNLALKPGNYTVEVMYSGTSEYYSNVTIRPSASTVLNMGVPRASSNFSIPIMSILTILTGLLLVSLVALTTVVLLKFRRLHN
jgi:YVTN family beta-propeller protein